MFDMQTFFIHVYVSALEYLLIYFLFSQYKPVETRMSKEKLILIFSIATLVQAFFDSFEYFIVNVITTAILFLLVSFCFFTKWKDVFLSSVIAIAVIDIGEGVASMLLMSTSVNSQDIEEFLLKPSNTILLFTISRLISLGLLMIILRFRKIKVGNNNLPIVYWTTFLFITMKDILWVLILTDSPVKISFYYWIAVIPLLPISYVLLYYTRRSIQNMIRSQVDSKLLDEKNKYYEQQLVTMKQTLESQKTVRHDLKNKLSPLIYLAENGEIDKLIEQVQELGSLNVLGNIYAESGNITVDYITNLKLHSIENKGVKISCDINIPNDIDIAPFDLSTILGNLIDNAAEALYYVKNQKWVSIKISYQVGFLIIHVANSFDGIIHLDQSEIISRKKDTENHGIGLNSIQTITEEYGGEMRIQYDENKFEIIVKLLA
ncbi:sensor histidine kinase [Brochothrix thermosphacta]|uniref:sensor histidine kinase n=1 Tax=Brochothrix thermosphacta TaxID=2756 RepID=UPI000EBC98E0|nr:GHKL domain-containing protein [Brochothrix thermosphacta]HCZ39816.1 histidine kinase [Brochothrix thermosphacta]HCZ45485.1 histidine kinase [Brochothrix thermosphacta]